MFVCTDACVCVHRHHLIVQGFIGALFSTVFFAVLASQFLSQYDYFVCPVAKFSVFEDEVGNAHTHRCSAMHTQVKMDTDIHVHIHTYTHTQTQTQTHTGTRIETRTGRH